MQDMQETWVRSLGQEDPLEQEIASNILAWEIPWTEEPGRLYLWCCKESDTTEQGKGSWTSYPLVKVQTDGLTGSMSSF